MPFFGSATRRRHSLIRVGVALLAAVAAVILGLSVAAMSRQVSSDNGVCGSAWHWRPGHGTSSGGERTLQQIHAQAALCRAAAKGAYETGLDYAIVGGCLLALAAVGGLGARSQRFSERSA